MCEEKMLNPKGTGGDIVMKMIDDANNLMVVRFFNLFDNLHLLQWSSKSHWQKSKTLENSQAEIKTSKLSTFTITKINEKLTSSFRSSDEPHPMKLNWNKITLQRLCTI